MDWRNILYLYIFIGLLHCITSIRKLKYRWFPIFFESLAEFIPQPVRVFCFDVENIGEINGFIIAKCIQKILDSGRGSIPTFTLFVQPSFCLDSQYYTSPNRIKSVAVNKWCVIRDWSNSFFSISFLCTLCTKHYCWMKTYYIINDKL